MDIQKISDTEIQVIKSETKETTSTFSLDYLLGQKKAIEDQQVKDNAQRNIELEEIDMLLAEADKQGLKTAAQVKTEAISADVIK